MASSNSPKQLIDYYEVLGVPPTATTADIRRAFHYLAFEALEIPALAGENEDNISARYDLMYEAYSILSDIKQRSAFELDRDEFELEKYRKRFDIPKRMEDSLKGDGAILRDRVLFWVKKLQVSISRILWFRLDKLETFLLKPLISPKLMDTFIPWHGEVERCSMRLTQLRRQIETGSASEWDETSREARKIAEELVVIRQCCVYWLRLADKLLDTANDFFDERGVFKRPEDWVSRTACNVQLQEIFNWDELQLPSEARD